jgi:hypothetical protein
MTLSSTTNKKISVFQHAWGGLLNSASKTEQPDTCVAAVYFATRIPHNSIDVILRAVIPLRRQMLEKVLCYLSHRRKTEVRKDFMSFKSLHLRVCFLFPSFLNYCYGVEIFPLVSHTPNILLLLGQTLQMVLSHLYYYIYYYSLHNGEFMFCCPFSLQLLLYWGRDFPASFP